MRRSKLRLALLGAIALACVSCLSPTLPLPPPEEPDSVTPGTTAGIWLVNGSCPSGYIVTVFDATQGEGVVHTCTPLGTYSVALAANKCDNAWVGFESTGTDSAGEETALTSFTVQDTRTDPLDAPCQ